MSKRVQPDLFENVSRFKPGRLEHGGDKSKGKRKVERPFARNRPLLITMKSERANGSLSMRSPRHQLRIKKLIEREIKKSNATLQRYANVSNHLHFVARFPSRNSFKRFLRVVTGLIARMVTGAQRGKSFGPFWSGLVHSRVLVGKRSILSALDYVDANTIQVSFGNNAREQYLESQRELRKKERDQNTNSRKTT